MERKPSLAERDHPSGDDTWLKEWSAGDESKEVIKKEVIKGERSESEAQPRLVRIRIKKELSRPESPLRPVKTFKDEARLERTKRKVVLEISAVYQAVVEKAEIAPDGSPYPCRFGCNKCTFFTARRKVLIDHFKQTGHRAKHKTEHNILKHLKTAFSHVCKICGQKVLYESDFLRDHLRKRHGVRSSPEYYRRFGIVKNREAKERLAAVLASSEVSERTSNACIFRCPNCGFEARTIQYLRDHFKETEHHAFKNRAEHAWLDFLTKTVCHICKICSSRILCENSYLINHIKSEHSLTLLGYNEKFGLSCRRGVDQLSKEAKVEAAAKLKALMKQADTAEEPGSLCTYQCKECMFETTDECKFRSHLRKTLHGPNCLSQYAVVDYIKKAVCHRCKICSQMILCLPNTLMLHFRRAHKCSITEYRCRYLGKGTAVKRVSTKSETHAFMITLRKTLESAEVSKETITLCIFSCKKCSFETRSCKNMTEHLKKTKHGSVSTSRNGILEYLSKAVCHICRVCDKRIFSETAHMQNHMRMRHNISLREYRNKMLEDDENSDKSFHKDAAYSERVVGNFCIYVCQNCKAVCKNYSQFETHRHQCGAPKMENAIQTVFWKSMTRKVIHRCLLCSKAVFCDMGYLRNHLTYYGHRLDSVEEYCKRTGCRLVLDPYAIKAEYPGKDSPVSKEIENRCQFKCLTCCQTFNSWSSLTHHHKKTGHATLKANSLYFQHLAKSVWYACHLCKEKILCDKYIITGHIKSRHGVNISGYRSLIGITTREDNTKRYKQYLDVILSRITHCTKQDTFIVTADSIKGQFTKHVGYLCEFKCRACSSSFTSWFALKCHMRKGHMRKALVEDEKRGHGNDKQVDFPQVSEV